MSFSPLTDATYELTARDRITGEPISGCSFDDVDLEGSFSRGLDTLGNLMEITVRLGGCEACSCKATERVTELHLTRDDWEEAAFVGPLLRTVDDPYQQTLRYVSQDRGYWWTGAPSPRDYDVTDRDTVLIFEDLIGLAEEYERSGLNTEYSGVGGPTPPLSKLEIDFDLLAGRSVFEQMASLAKSGVDFAVVGPHLYWGAPAIPLQKGPQLRSEVWGQQQPIVDRDATSVATKVVVTGAGGITASYPSVEVDLGYGKRTLFINDTNLDDVEEALALAQRTYEQNVEPSPFVITGDGTLSTAFPQPLHKLIPGRLYDVVVEGQCLEASETMRLSGITVEFGTQLVKGTRQIKEKRVAADFQLPGTLASAERASA